MNYIKKNKTLLFIFFISLIPLFNLLTPGLPISHDGLDHIARIANFYQNLTERNFIPRWAGNLNWGYGHPILMFLYPLPSYFVSFFHLIGLSFIDSFKLVMAASFILSGIFMYLWLKNFLNEQSAVVGALLYLFAPYRFIDLYVRGALGEHMAFLFLPLVLLAILKLNNADIKNRIGKYYFYFLFSSLAFAGLILSHNGLSLIFIPFIIFYLLYLYLENKNLSKLLLNIAPLLYGFFLSFFFWFPAFVEGKYTLRDIVTSGAYQTRFVEIKNLFYSPWNFGGSGQFSIQIGIAGVLLTVISILMYNKIFKNKDIQKYLWIGSFIFLLLSIFLMLKQSNFIWQNFTTLQKLQFPWRFLSLSVFLTSLLGAMFIYKTRANKFLSLAIVLLIIIPTISYWHAKAYKIIPDSFFETIYSGTTDTGESSPIWSVRFMEKGPKKSIEIISGSAQISELPSKITIHEYAINVAEKTRFRENTLYFPGWKVYDNYKLINTEFQDPKNRGLITFYVDKGLHDIIIKFEDTKLRKFANRISIISIVALLLMPLTLYTFPKLKIGKFQW